MSTSYKLVNNESLEETFLYVADVAHIKANATVSNQVIIGEIPAGGAVKSVYVYEKVPLAGASDITLDVGTTANDPDEFINALDVDGMSAPVYNTGDAFEAANAEGIAIVGKTNTATDILAEWNGTVNDLTAGKVVVAVTVFNPGKFGN